MPPPSPYILQPSALVGLAYVAYILFLSLPLGPRLLTPSLPRTLSPHTHILPHTPTSLLITMTFARTVQHVNYYISRVSALPSLALFAIPFWLRLSAPYDPTYCTFLVIHPRAAHLLILCGPLSPSVFPSIRHRATRRPGFLSPASALVLDFTGRLTFRTIWFPGDHLYIPESAQNPDDPRTVGTIRCWHCGCSDSRFFEF
ncbi:hypothetical protein K438DRAFT_1989298 [Mycena galopus ATCC 62051]|nr:hypothetical protein K438DRAFT_1989298 [Mycena galopus ATCC 62051]